MLSQGWVWDLAPALRASGSREEGRGGPRGAGGQSTDLRRGEKGLKEHSNQVKKESTGSCLAAIWKARNHLLFYGVSTRPLSWGRVRPPLDGQSLSSSKSPAASGQAPIRGCSLLGHWPRPQPALSSPTCSQPHLWQLSQLLRRCGHRRFSWLKLVAELRDGTL